MYNGDPYNRLSNIGSLLPYDPGQRKTIMPVGSSSSSLPSGWAYQDPSLAWNNPTSQAVDAAMGTTPQGNTGINYNDPAWLKSIGYTGPAPMSYGGMGSANGVMVPAQNLGSAGVQNADQSAQMNPAFAQYLQSKGLTLGFNAGPQDYSLAAFGPNGQVGTTNSWTENDDPGNIFLMAMLGAAGFAGSAAAGAGAAAGGTDAATAGAGAGDAGLQFAGMPAQASITAPGSLAGAVGGVGANGVDSALLAPGSAGLDAGSTGAADAAFGGSGTIAGGNGISAGTAAAGASPYSLAPAAGATSALGGAVGGGGSSLLSSLGGINTIGMGVGALNGLLGFVAANKAAGVQANAAQQAQAALNAQTALNQQNQAPYIAAGTQALGTIGDLMGTSGNTSAPNYGSFNHQFNASDLNSNLAPNYQFQLQQGLGAVTNAGNASGFSGNTLKGINDYAQNYAAGAYQQAFSNYTANQTNIYNRLANLAGLGQTANQAQAQIGSQNTATAGQFGTSGAAATAGGIVGGVNALTNGLNNVNAWNYLSGSPTYGGGYGSGWMGNTQSGWVYSDRRLKTNIEKIGETDKGLPLYTYRYKGSDQPQIGPMAQEVEKIAPWMVAKDASGFRKVNLTALRDI